jgi:hypothetical protein
MLVVFSAPMKRLIVVLGAAALMALCVPAASLGQVPTQDSVVATGVALAPVGIRLGGFTNIDINVQSGPSGESVTGRVKYTLIVPIPPTPTSVDVDLAPLCLSVVGNTAVVNLAAPGFGSGAVGVRLVDNGPAGSGVDTINLTIPSVATDCSSPPLPGGTGLFSFTSGDVVVVDAQPPPPLPNSKEQCKDGGWQQFDFKNQGQCVAFVNREAPS